MTRDPYRRLMNVLDDAPEGLGGVPSAWRSGKVRASGSPYRTLHLRTDNDASELLMSFAYDDEGPGTQRRVLLSLSRSEAHRFAWWVIRWYAAEWFGLRRRLYYAALRRHLDVEAPSRHGRPDA